MQKEMQIQIREVRKGQKEQQSVFFITLSPKKGKCTCPWKVIRITACPPWIKNPICSECGKSAVPSQFYEGGVPTLLEIDKKAPRIFCDKCREDLFAYRGKWKNECKHVQIQNEFNPTPKRNIWHSRFEWSVTGERWYRVKYENIKPFLPYTAERIEITKKFNEFMNTLHRGNTLKVKARYDKGNKILEVNVASF